MPFLGRLVLLDVDAFQLEFVDQLAPEPVVEEGRVLFVARREVGRDEFLVPSPHRTVLAVRNFSPVSHRRQLIDGDGDQDEGRDMTLLLIRHEGPQRREHPAIEPFQIVFGDGLGLHGDGFFLS